MPRIPAPKADRVDIGEFDLHAHSPELDPLFSRGLESIYYRMGYLANAFKKIRHDMAKGALPTKEFKRTFPEYRDVWGEPKMGEEAFVVRRIRYEIGEALGWWSEENKKGVKKGARNGGTR